MSSRFRKNHLLLFLFIITIFMMPTLPFVNAQVKQTGEISCNPDPEKTSPKLLGKAWTKLTISINPHPKQEVNVVVSLYDTSDKFVSKVVEKVPIGGEKTVDYGVGLQDGAWKVTVEWNGDSELNGDNGSCNIFVELNGWQKILSWGIGVLNFFNITSMVSTAFGFVYIIKTLRFGGTTKQVSTRYLKTGVIVTVLRLC